MEDLFPTAAWETVSSNEEPVTDPLWVRVCALAGGLLLVGAGVALVAVHGQALFS